ncbi:MAG: hypothetical protein EOO52_08695 [Gammaproteobacteria bacterium]|nr:MAG: hypothetical protein EOO52_08695 [Gammaproteobacteria bacterium]
MRKKISLSIFLLLLCASGAHSELSRVYHPYVEQHEREIEYGFLLRDAGNTNVLLNRAGVGYAWTDKFFSEIYLLTESITHDNQQVRGYEAEFKWQLTEQGEYWADWGLLIEAGEGRDIDSHEIAAGLLWEKELSNNWIATANVFIEYESGRDVENEFESAFRGQLRYRNSAEFDPALEIYLDDQDRALGPSFMGALKLGGKKQIRWELGVLFGLDSRTPDTNIRGGLEFEF